uniref:c-type cytochrome biogenesis protein CcmI n=1 Tax=Thaumasiovibrio occultus TaxID=1891184 RepID=UPI000B35D9C9|nr:c-type cytochrome biogenesis protein CcmI [Thaumasiovibrio occultus]
MMWFWLSTVVLSAVVLACVLVPMFSSKSDNSSAERDELNKALYRDRLRELDSEDDTGLVQDKGGMVSDLQKTLLADVPEQTGQQRSGRVTGLVVLVVVLSMVTTYASFWRYGGLAQVEHWQETAKRLPELSAKLMSDSDTPFSDQELSDFTLALRTQLDNQPPHAEQTIAGWVLLGRLGIASGDLDTSQGAMRKAWRIAPERLDTQLGYARTLLLSADSFDRDKALRMLDNVLATSPSNFEAISLLAFDALAQEDYVGAINYWVNMKTLLPANDPRGVMIDRSIAMAQQQMQGGEPVVEITIDIARNAPVPAGVLIVSAHTIDGAKMPVAARRLPLSAFPLSVTLSTKDDMIQGRSLADLDSMLIRVRIDSDGEVGTADNAWFAESEAVEPGQSVTVVLAPQES